MSDQKLSHAIFNLKQTVATLRGPNGCRWDKEQTHETLAQYAIEETYELVDSIEAKNPNSIKEELGDVLFQVVLHAQLAEENNQFDLSEVINLINEKLIRRHPHVFGNTQVSGIDEIWKNWEQIKLKEKNEKKSNSFGVPNSLPALQAAHKIGEKTHRAHFDWRSPEEVWMKVQEEIAELRQAMDSRDKNETALELGDVLFSLSQLARHLNIESELALRKTNQIFEKRYLKMMDLAEKRGVDFRTCEDAAKESLWAEAKKLLEEDKLNNSTT